VRDFIRVSPLILLVSEEGMFANHHDVHDDANSPEIHSLSVYLPLSLLGSHV